jgi:hypothetical protein
MPSCTYAVVHLPQVAASLHAAEQAVGGDVKAAAASQQKVSSRWPTIVGMSQVCHVDTDRLTSVVRAAMEVSGGEWR